MRRVDLPDGEPPEELKAAHIDLARRGAEEVEKRALDQLNNLRVRIFDTQERIRGEVQKEVERITAQRALSLTIELQEQSLDIRGLRPETRRRLVAENVTEWAHLLTTDAVTEEHFARFVRNLVLLLDSFVVTLEGGEELPPTSPHTTMHNALRALEVALNKWMGKHRLGLPVFDDDDEGDGGDEDEITGTRIDA